MTVLEPYSMLGMTDIPNSGPFYVNDASIAIPCGNQVIQQSLDSGDRNFLLTSRVVPTDEPHIKLTAFSVTRTGRFFAIGSLRKNAPPTLTLYDKNDRELMSIQGEKIQEFTYVSFQNTTDNLLLLATEPRRTRLELINYISRRPVSEFVSPVHFETATFHPIYDHLIFLFSPNQLAFFTLDSKYYSDLLEQQKVDVGPMELHELIEFSTTYHHQKVPQQTGNSSSRTKDNTNFYFTANTTKTPGIDQTNSADNDMKPSNIIDISHCLPSSQLENTRLVYLNIPNYSNFTGFAGSIPEPDVWAVSSGREILFIKNGAIDHIITLPDGNNITYLSSFSHGFLVATTQFKLYLIQHIPGLHDLSKTFQLSFNYNYGFSHPVTFGAYSPSKHQLILNISHRALIVVNLSEFESGSDGAISNPNILSHFGPIISITSCAFKPLLASCGSIDRTIIFWDYSRQCAVQRYEMNEDLKSISFHPSGDLVAVASSEKLYLMAVTVDSIVVRTSWPLFNCLSIAFSNGGPFLAAAFRPGPSAPGGSSPPAGSRFPRRPAH